MDEQPQPPETDVIERNDALNFAHRTRTNLQFLEHHAAAGEAVHPVTQLINSLLGLLVFLKEQKFNEEIRSLSLTSLESQGWPRWRSDSLTRKHSGSLCDICETRSRTAVSNSPPTLRSYKTSPLNSRTVIRGPKP